jgi:hypothetical protein
MYSGRGYVIDKVVNNPRCVLARRRYRYRPRSECLWGVTSRDFVM